MKKTFALLAAAVMLAGLTACSTVTTSTALCGLKLDEKAGTQSLGHVNGNIWGIYLFHALPIMAGSVTNPGKVTAFIDTVSVDNAVSMAAKEASKKGATSLIDLTTSRTSMWYCLILTFEKVEVSGNAIK